MAIDDGYFPRATSVLRHVQEERAVGLFYGQRSLCVGALKPLNYVGTSEHTANRRTPFKRLAHTGTWFELVMLGSRDEADRVLKGVERMHTRVNGTLPEDAGPYPAGTPYDAFDPELMLWTVAVTMDSAERFYDLLVRPLREYEREGLWQDYIRFGELFGMPRAVAPPSYRAFREWFDAQIAGDDLFLTEEARYMGYATAFEIPMAPHKRMGKAVHDLVMLGSLPPRVRELYGLPWSPARAAAFRAVTRMMRGARRLTPDRTARGRCAAFYDEVARIEAHRIATGQPTPQLAIDPPGRVPQPSR